MRTKSLFLLIITALILSACGTKNEESHQSHSHGDLQEKTASVTIMPDFLNGQSDKIRLVYQIAGQASDLLQWIPCYCGCGESAGHKSNLNCFINEVNEDGSVVWDDHGTRCGVCMEIAVTAAKMKSEGKSDKEIRNFIDETYKEGYSDSTDSPMPA
ncbi:PCYCGC motif-containing (lipo)protein [Paenibacillus sp. LHD-38]|uniref:PCYCGC motif-containing (lipo)protein n=1 Tax=Paenibacillus sp. LHD-38 TaxID=3072143 RepID=UPI0028107561|nr:PCYCGC motif-containing (lipo)protein [Paenibacillus sp. LHD-38]MDQ8733562.1 PCYCGC motif-containing (lipo)protein [Paenibacillus sp. LHD-38]